MIQIWKGTTSAFVIAAAIAGGAIPANAGGTLRLDEVPVGELDPAKASDYADSLLMFNAYDTLVLPVQGGPGYQPHLAKEWKIDGNIITVTLRDDVSFQSGNPMTAADVVFSLDRMQAIGQGLSFLFTIVEKAEAVDDHTVRFTLKEPYSPFIASLTRLPIVDRATVMEHLGEGGADEWGQTWLSAHSAGTGAYTVTEHNPQEQTVFARNDSYFLPVDTTAPDEVRLRYGLESATLRAMMAQGEHDITSQWLPPEVMKAMADSGAHMLQESGTGGFYIKLNTQKAPLDDVNCRLALASAFDYTTALAITKITADVSGGVASTGAIPNGMLGANDPAKPLVRDMDAARAHLEKCKYDPAEFTLELTWIAEVPIEERFALLMQANFSELGFKSEIARVPWVLFTERVSSPETTPHVSQIYTNAVTGDPDTLLYAMYHSSAQGTWQSPEHLNDPEVDRLLAGGRAVTTDEERGAIYAELNARLMALAPTIYGYDRNSVFAGSQRVTVPAMEDPAKAFGLDGLGFSFRLMQMAD